MLTKWFQQITQIESQILISNYNLIGYLELGIPCH